MPDPTLDTAMSRPRWRRLLQALRRPIDAEKRRLLAERWHGLPEELRVPWQVVGQSFTL